MYHIHPGSVSKMADCWSKLNPPLSESTLKVLDEVGFKTMTPVQVRNDPVPYIILATRFSVTEYVRIP